MSAPFVGWDQRTVCASAPDVGSFSSSGPVIPRCTAVETPTVDAKGIHEFIVGGKVGPVTACMAAFVDPSSPDPVQVYQCVERSFL